MLPIRNPYVLEPYSKHPTLIHAFHTVSNKPRKNYFDIMHGHMTSSVREKQYVHVMSG